MLSNITRTMILGLWLKIKFLMFLNLWPSILLEKELSNSMLELMSLNYLNISMLPLFSINIRNWLLEEWRKRLRSQLLWVNLRVHSEKEFPSVTQTIFRDGNHPTIINLILIWELPSENSSRLNWSQTQNNGTSRALSRRRWSWNAESKVFSLSASDSPGPPTTTHTRRFAATSSIRWIPSTSLWCSTKSTEPDPVVSSGACSLECLSVFHPSSSSLISHSETESSLSVSMERSWSVSLSLSPGLEVTSPISRQLLWSLPAENSTSLTDSRSGSRTVSSVIISLLQSEPEEREWEDFLSSSSRKPCQELLPEKWNVRVCGAQEPPLSSSRMSRSQSKISSDKKIRDSPTSWKISTTNVSSWSCNPIDWEEFVWKNQWNSPTREKPSERDLSITPLSEINSPIWPDRSRPLMPGSNI